MVPVARGGAALPAVVTVVSGSSAALVAAVVSASVRGDAALEPWLLLFAVCSGALPCWALALDAMKLRCCCRVLGETITLHCGCKI